ncbi:hypothetical protein ABZ646_35680, partial [Streptomyces sp. NPDC007162]
MIRSGGQPGSTRRPTGDSGPVRFRERFLQGEQVDSGVRAPILDSWLRCQSLGLSPDRADLPFHEDFDPGGPIVRAAVPVLDRLQALFSGSQINISLADASGTVLLRRFGDPAMPRSLPPIQVVPGFVFAERFAGTNGIGLALAERGLVRVFGAEHFAERAQGNACIAAPVRDPLSGRMEGVLCFGYHRSAEDPALGDLIRRAVRAVEGRLLRQSSARERVLLRAYESAVGLPLGLSVDERVLDLRPADRVILMEKAAELISRGRHAAMGVSLSDGRRVTLVSRRVTGASGVQGLAVEMLLPGLAVRAPLDVSPHQVRLDAAFGSVAGDGLGDEGWARTPGPLRSAAGPTGAAGTPAVTARTDTTGPPNRSPAARPPDLLLRCTPAQPRSPAEPSAATPSRSPAEPSAAVPPGLPTEPAVAASSGSAAEPSAAASSASLAEPSVVAASGLPAEPSVAPSGSAAEPSVVAA